MREKTVGIKRIKLDQDAQRKKLSVPLALKSRKRSREKRRGHEDSVRGTGRGRAAIKTKAGTLERGAGVDDSAPVNSTSFSVTHIHEKFTGGEPGTGNVHTFSGGLFRIPGHRLGSQQLSSASSPCDQLGRNPVPLFPHTLVWAYVENDFNFEKGWSLHWGAHNPAICITMPSPQGERKAGRRRIFLSCLVLQFSVGFPYNVSWRNLSRTALRAHPVSCIPGRELLPSRKCLPQCLLRGCEPECMVGTQANVN